MPIAALPTGDYWGGAIALDDIWVTTSGLEGGREQAHTLATLPTGFYGVPAITADGNWVTTC